MLPEGVKHFNVTALAMCPCNLFGYAFFKSINRVTFLVVLSFGGRTYEVRYIYQFSSLSSFCRILYEVRHLKAKKLQSLIFKIPETIRFFTALLQFQ